METVKAFLGSIRLGNLKAALFAWFFNFFFFLVAISCFYQLLSTAAGESLVPEPLAGTPAFIDLVTDIWVNRQGGVELWLFLIFFLLLLFIPVSIFVAGGIYGLLVDDRKVTFSGLWMSAVDNFFSMVKMFLVNLVNWGAALVLPLLLAAIFWEGLFAGSPGLSASPFIYIWLAAAALLLVVAVGIYDFSRIARLQEGGSVLHSFWRGICWVFGNKFAAATLLLLYLLCLFILYLVVSVITSFSFPLPSGIALFVFYQLITILRYFLKVVVMHGEIKIAAAVGH